ncbi:MAG TPA: hypothetical protein VNQ73_16395 [Ilumatobacter sp.]|nr:hypothetical protein [Ilumatobacter sp.]
MTITDAIPLEQREALAAVLDPTLASNAFADSPPSGPTELATAADPARSVTSSTDPDGTNVVTARVDGDALATPNSADDSASGPLKLHFRFDDLGLAATAAQPLGAQWNFLAPPVHP